MSIHFSPDRWDKIRRDYALWWDHKLTRPLINVQAAVYDPGRPCPKAPLLNQRTSLDLSWTPEELCDRIDYELSKLEFLGDAFPYFNMDCFGPGVLAAFLGATPDNRTGRIWFYPTEEKELSGMHFTYQPDNIWFRRVRDIYRAANRRWHGQVIMGMVDLGGILDVLATFRGTDNLLMDLYDEPEEVLRLVGELHGLWMRYYNELCDILAEEQPGFSDWSRIFSETRSYIPQSDFCFMISNDMFRQFVLEDLRQFTEELDHTIYHLDGPGELKHLDDILTLPRLNAVQWIPGDGHPDQCCWPEIYQKIRAAGKYTQLFHGYESVAAVTEQTGSPEGIHFYIGEVQTPDSLPHHHEMLRKYGVI